MINTQTPDCYSLVWENPRHVDEAVRRCIRFERNFSIQNVPIEISSENTLEISYAPLINQTNDAYIILQTLARVAKKKYRSINVLNKGAPIVRWTNTSATSSATERVWMDLVIDARDVSNFISLERSFEFNRCVTMINIVAFVCIMFMFVHFAARVS